MRRRLPRARRCCGYEPSAGTPAQNFSDDLYGVTIEDLRGRDAEFTLDRHGFAPARHRSGEFVFENEDRIRDLYYPESEALLAELLGADRARTFEHTIPPTWSRPTCSIHTAPARRTP